MKQFKNLTTDFVCGMDLSETGETVKFYYKKKPFYFCSESCKERFEENPEKYQKEPLIKLSNIWKIFKLGKTEIQALKDFSLHIWEGDFAAIIGSSGSGKSTLLNIIGLLDTPTSGKFFLNASDLSLFSEDERAEFRSRIFGFVFQQYNLIPWLTVYENITLPLIFSKKNIEKEKIYSYLKEAGLFERLAHRPFELSGGEQQRTALLRALANDPQIIIADEPTGNLDSETGNKILELLINLNKNQKKTLIIVTHDADIAQKANQIITIKDGKMIKDHKVYKKIYTE